MAILSFKNMMPTAIARGIGRAIYNFLVAGGIKNKSAQEVKKIRQKQALLFVLTIGLVIALAVTVSPGYVFAVFFGGVIILGWINYGRYIKSLAEGEDGFKLGFAYTGALAFFTFMYVAGVTIEEYHPITQVTMTMMGCFQVSIVAEKIIYVIAEAYHAWINQDQKKES